MRSISPLPSRPRVGSTLIPGLTTTVADRSRVLDELHTEFVQFQGDVFRAAGWTEAHPVLDESTPAWRWWSAVARPIVEEWQRFYSDQTGSWWSRFQTDWDVYTGWQERLFGLRKLAREELAKWGHKLQSPDPSRVPRTPWDLLRDVGDTTRDAAKAAKWVVGAAGGLLVVMAAVKIARAYRGTPAGGPQ